MPLVSAIVLNYRTPFQAVRCVQALLKQSIAGQMEIIVVDNHSADDSIGILRNRLLHFPQVSIIETPHNVGFGRGYNLGIRRASGAFILLNNPAKILRADAVAQMVTAMQKAPEIGILGPKLLHEDETIRDSSRCFPTIQDVIIKRTFLRQCFPTRMRRYLHQDADPGVMRSVDWVIGGCMMIRHDLAMTLGGFDPRFFLFFEDIDLCRRCHKEGKRVVYFPNAEAIDRKRRLSEGGVFSLLSRRVGWAHIASAVKYFWKWRKAESIL